MKGKQGKGKISRKTVVGTVEFGSKKLSEKVKAIKRKVLKKCAVCGKESKMLFQLTGFFVSPPKGYDGIVGIRSELICFKHSNEELEAIKKSFETAVEEFKGKEIEKDNTFYFLDGDKQELEGPDDEDIDDVF
jgi:undecaprenyl pyrophosphate synthase